jgi:large subunit ribosomal protein L9
MVQMKLILRETIEALGTVGDEVDVAKGYARNYLIPHNKAVLATSTNRKLIEKDRKKLELQALKEKGLAETQAQALAGIVCSITAKVSEEDRLYGSVSARDIWDQLKAQGIDVDKRMILLSEPIKTLGSYLVPIQLHPKVKPEITVKVVAEE